MHKKFTISLLIGCVLSIMTLYLAFRNVPAADLLVYLKGINFWWLIPSFALVIATFILRTFRWQIILREISHIDFPKAFHPLMIGFMMNCVLPGRVGEIARPALLKKKEGIPMSAGLATVAAERVMDVTFLIILFILTFSTVFNQTSLQHSASIGNLSIDKQMLQNAAWTMTRLSILLVACIAVFSLKNAREGIKHLILGGSQWLASKYPGKRDIFTKMAQSGVTIIDHTAAGFALVRRPWRLLACIGLTIVIWGLTVLSYYIFSMGCPGVNLSLWNLTVFMVVICFFVALPSVPGFWGVWEAGGVFALSLFGIPVKEAAGFTLVTHSVQMFPVIVIGIISALVTSVNILQVNRQKIPADAPQPRVKGDVL
jgi:glycosyltransferase 2 family protein